MKDKPSSVPQANPLKKIFEFPVLWDGWECDSKAWVAERQDGSRCIIMTDHGGEYEANPKEVRDRIAEYQSVIAKSEKALEMLG